MMAWLRSQILRWLRLKPVLNEPGAAPDWLETDRARWAAFLQSETGRKIVRRSEAVQFEMAKTACADSFHTSHSAGSAHGFGECLAWLNSLSRSSRAPEETGPDGQTNTSTTGEPSHRELMSP